MQVETTPIPALLVFVSSGDDVARLRKLVERLVNEAIDPVLRENELPVRLEVDLWERSAAQRVRPGETANTRFVNRARKASLVLSMLHEEISEGTLDELEAVLHEEDIELSVVWCVERDDDWPDTHAGRWLGQRRDLNQLFIDRAGAPDTLGPEVAIVRILLEAALTAARKNQAQEPLRERR